MGTSCLKEISDFEDFEDSAPSKISFFVPDVRLHAVARGRLACALARRSARSGNMTT